MRKSQSRDEKLKCDMQIEKSKPVIWRKAM